MLLSKKLTTVFTTCLIFLSMSSCVQNPTETKAKCGEFEAFDSVSRSCFSLSNYPQAPRPNLDSLTLAGEVAQRVNLTYTDSNGDLALSCRAISNYGTNSNVLVLSPAVSDGSYEQSLGEVLNAMNNLYYALPGGESFTSNAQTNLVNVQNIYNIVRQSFNINTIKTNTALVRSNINSMVMNAQTGLNQMGPGHNYFVQVSSYLDFLKNININFDRIAQSVDDNCICDGGECYTNVIPKMGYQGENGFSYAIRDKDGISQARPVKVSVKPLNPQLSSMRPIIESTHYIFAEDGNNLVAPVSYEVADLGIARNLYDYQIENFSYQFQGLKVDCETSGCYGRTFRGGRISGCLDLIGSSGPADKSCTYRPATNNDNNFVDSVMQVAAKASNTIDGIKFEANSNGRFGNQIQLQLIDIKLLNIKDYDSFASKQQIYGLIDITEGEAYVRLEGNRIKIFYNEGITTKQQLVNLINSHPLARNLVTASVVGAHGLAAGSYNTGSLPVNLTLGNDGYDFFAYSTNNGISSSLNTAHVSISMLPINDPPRVPDQYRVNGECTVIELSTECLPAVSLIEDQVAKVVEIKFRDVDIDDLGRNFNIKKKIREGICLPQPGSLDSLAGVDSSNFLMVPAAYSHAVGFAAGSVKLSSDITLQPRNDFNGSACLYYQITDSAGGVSNIQGVSISVSPVNDSPMLGFKNALGKFEEFTGPVEAARFDEDLDVANRNNTFEFLSHPGGLGKFENNQVLTLSYASADNTVIDFSKACVGTGAVIEDYFPGKVCKLADDSFLSSVTIITEPHADINDTKILKNTIIFVPKKDKSGTTNFTMTITDDDKAGPVADLSKTYNFTVVVDPVNDPPYFIPANGENLAIVHSNEGGMIQTFPFRINEDEGDTIDEDVQGIIISSITSDNVGLLPASNITMFYDLNDNGVEDPGETRVVGNMLEAVSAADAKLHRLYLKLQPIAGEAGSTNIILTVTDNGLNPVLTSHKFSYVVRPIAAIHKGWDNISSVGIKTNKKSEPVEVSIDSFGHTLMTSDLKCNFNKGTDNFKCNTSNCIGSQPPNSVVSASGENVLYWDSNNKKCYRSRDEGDSSWEEFNTSCPVTRKPDMPGVCSGNNCIVDTGVSLLSSVPDFIGQYKYALDQKKCYRAQDITALSWTEYIPTKVTLEWKPFTIVGSGIYSNVGVRGYNVYRREPTKDYDFGVSGHLIDHNSKDGMSVSGASVRIFTDTTAIAGKVYYYVVRPVDSITYYPTYTSEKFSEVRLVASPENYAFVHRWMVNQEVCRGMNMTESPSPGMPHVIDPNKNYTCSYVGPGRSDDGSDSIYDYGRDLLVDIQEAGCSYGVSPKCSSNGCVGTTPPISTSNVVNGDLYYDRSNGTCYAYNGGWSSVTDSEITLTIANKVNSALNPPLVNVSKLKAQAACAQRSLPVMSGITLTGSAILPNKKDYIGYSAHKTSLLFSETIRDLEMGFSLNVQSSCNGSYASGLDSSFTNSDVPLNSYMFAIAGTQNSTIRSLHTGSVPWGESKSTNQCVSRYGIQDLYGNVAEWLNDSFKCSVGSVYLCAGEKDLVSSFSFKDNEFKDGTTQSYDFDGIIGPANLSVGFIQQFSLANNPFGSIYYNYPLGLPISEEIRTKPSLSQSFDWLLDTSSSVSKLNDDSFIFYRDHVIVDDEIRDVTVGGSYKSNTFPGRFTTELIGTTEPLRNDVGFRCAIPVESSLYPQFPAGDPYHKYSY